MKEKKLVNDAAKLSRARYTQLFGILICREVNLSLVAAEVPSLASEFRDYESLFHVAERIVGITFLLVYTQRNAYHCTDFTSAYALSRLDYSPSTSSSSRRAGNTLGNLPESLPAFCDSLALSR